MTLSLVRRRAIGYLVFLSIFLGQSESFGENEVCVNTPPCRCKWSKGKKTADCSNAGLSSIPSTLSEDIQTLILDGNPLHHLEKNAFKKAGLQNLQKISLQGCSLSYVDDFVFRDLRILVDVDLSGNNITKLGPKIFDGNDALQTIKLSHNPLGQLQAYQFPPLRNLKTIDVSHSQLQSIESKAFHNIGTSLHTIQLQNNRLKSLDVDSFVALTSLKNLQLNDNPWVCDCRLKSFRDWLISKKLYAKPTICNEPSRLHGKTWDAITASEFACRPDMRIPQRYVFSGSGRNATLACLITGSPTPQLKWVINGQIIHNYTSPAPFSDQRWIITEEEVDSSSRWYNLTVLNAGHESLGDYLCVAENSAGQVDRTITLTFDDPSTLISGGGVGLGADKWTVITAVTTAAIVFVVIILIICCFWRVRKRKLKEKQKAEENSRPMKTFDSAISAYGDHGTLMTGLSMQQTADFTEESQALLSPHQREMFVSTPRVAALTQDRLSSRGGTPDSQFIPDLLEVSTLTRTMSSPISHSQNTLPVRKTSTPLSATGLMHNPSGPAAFYRSGTLPHHYQYQQGGRPRTASASGGRSISCDHSSQGNPIYQQRVLQPLQLHQLPSVQYNHPLALHKVQLPATNSRQARPGYVTLPRRPRTSWSSPIPPQGLSRDSPSPSIHSQFGGSRSEYREPIYDGIGPRTSADGSSRANLNSTTLPRNLNKSADSGVRPPLGSGSGYALPPYYAPIAEECPPTPKDRFKASPKTKENSTSQAYDKVSVDSQSHDMDSYIDSSVATSNSEITLMEENMSGYCEPFGKAVPPRPEDFDPLLTPTLGSVASAGSDFELNTSPKDNKVGESPPQRIPSPKSTTSPRGAPPLPAVRKKIPATIDENTTLKLPNGSPTAPSPSASMAETSFDSNVANNNSSVDNEATNINGNADSQNSAKKVPPKTLPKPKIRPLWNPGPALIGNSFQDEGVDGSEV